MSELPSEVKTAINIAIAVAEGLPGGKVTADLIGDAIRLSHHKVVPASGDETPANDAAPPRTVPRVPEKWPKQCKRCNKVINNKAHADECGDTACPI